MKKLLVIALLFVLGLSMYALASPVLNEVLNLAGSTWKFKSVVAENRSTAEYVTSVYGEAEYKFADNHTYSGSFFGLSIAGTWEVSDSILTLNKGTYKEETYTVASLSQNNFVLQATENGGKVFIEFVKK